MNEGQEASKIAHLDDFVTLTDYNCIFEFSPQAKAMPEADRQI